MSSFEDKGREAIDRAAVSLDRASLRPTHEVLAEVFARVCEVVEKKEKLYGGSWRRRGWRGNLVRTFSKSDRLENMLWRRVDETGEERRRYYRGTQESVEDTALDLIALAAMFIVNYEAGNEWGNGER